MPYTNNYIILVNLEKLITNSTIIKVSNYSNAEHTINPAWADVANYYIEVTDLLPISVVIFYEDNRFLLDGGGKDVPHYNRPSAKTLLRIF